MNNDANTTAPALRLNGFALLKGYRDAVEIVEISERTVLVRKPRGTARLVRVPATDLTPIC